MKAFYFFILVNIFLFLGCKNKPNIPLTQKAIATQLDLEPEEKIIKISIEKDTIIHGKKGTAIFIEQNSFEDLEGNPITGDIELKIKEVIDYSDIFSEQISTITADGGILETRGMMKIDAFSKGREIRLKTGKEIEISIPKSELEEKGMQLYYGIENEDGTVVWEIADSSESSPQIDDKFITLDGNDMSDPDFPDYYFSSSKSYNPEKGDSLIFRAFYQSFFKNIYDEKTFSKRNVAFIRSFEKNIPLTTQEKIAQLGSLVRIHFLLFKDGDLEIINLEGEFSNKTKQRIIEKLDRSEIKEPFLREGDPSEIEGEIHLTSYLLKRRSKLESFTNSYLMKSQKLGWINCDFFIEFDAPKINMAVTVPNENTFVKLVFKKYKSVLSGSLIEGKYVFPNIPEGEEVQIIALNHNNAEASVSITEAKITKEVSAINPFEKVSLDELKNRLNRLN